MGFSLQSSRLIVGVLVISILVAAAVLLYMFRSQLLVWLPGPSAISGTFILNVPESWEVPGGGTIAGLVSYTPHTGETAYLVTPGAPAAPLMVTGAVSQTGERVAAVEAQGSSELLVSFLLPSQTTEKHLATHSSDAVFVSAVWSQDETVFAYRTLSLLPGEHASEVRVVFMSGDSKPALTLADSIVAPLAFSPDSTELLVVKTSGLGMISLLDGTERTINFDVSPDIAYFNAAQNGRYLAVGSETNSVLYTIDWTEGSIALLGTIQTPQIVFGGGNALLGVDSVSSRVSVYEVNNGTLELMSTKSLGLPTSAQVLGWMP